MQVELETRMELYEAQVSKLQAQVVQADDEKAVLEGTLQSLRTSADGGVPNFVRPACSACPQLGQSGRLAACDSQQAGSAPALASVMNMKKSCRACAPVLMAACPTLYAFWPCPALPCTCMSTAVCMGCASAQR